MKNSSNSTKCKVIRIAVTGTVVLAMAFAAFILPLRPKVSEAEKRELAKFPEFSITALLNGS